VTTRRVAERYRERLPKADIWHDGCAVWPDAVPRSAFTPAIAIRRRRRCEPSATALPAV